MLPLTGQPCQGLFYGVPVTPGVCKEIDHLEIPSYKVVTGRAQKVQMLACRMGPCKDLRCIKCHLCEGDHICKAALVC